MVDWADLTLFLYITARMSGFILFNPILGRRGIPGLFRGGFVLVLSLFVRSVTDQTVEVPTTTLGLGVHILLELGLGFCLGMIVSFFLFIPQMAGQVIDTQMGMTMNQTYDPSTQANTSVSGRILNTLMLMVFFAANGHHTMLRILMTSGEVVGFGQVSLGTGLMGLLLELFAQCAVLAIKLAMPVLAAELIGQLGMGVLMKVIPQINVFAINIDLKVMVGLVMMYLLMLPFGDFMLDIETTMLDSLSQALAAAA